MRVRGGVSTGCSLRDSRQGWERHCLDWPSPFHWQGMWSCIVRTQGRLSLNQSKLCIGVYWRLGLFRMVTHWHLPPPLQHLQNAISKANLYNVSLAFFPFFPLFVSFYSIYLLYSLSIDQRTFEKQPSLFFSYTRTNTARSGWWIVAESGGSIALGILLLETKSDMPILSPRVLHTLNQRNCCPQLWSVPNTVDRYVLW